MEQATFNIQYRPCWRKYSSQIGFQRILSKISMQKSDNVRGKKVPSYCILTDVEYRVEVTAASRGLWRGTKEPRSARCDYYEKGATQTNSNISRGEGARGNQQRGWKVNNGNQSEVMLCVSKRGLLSSRKSRHTTVKREFLLSQMSCRTLAREELNHVITQVLGQQGLNLDILVSRYKSTRGGL